MTALSNGSHCHHLVAETAKGMAHEVYASVMRDNTQYAQWKEMCEDLTPDLAENLFVAKLWPKLIEQARTTLTRMLTQPGPEELKIQIHDALVKDNMLREGRARAIARQVN